MFNNKKGISLITLVLIVVAVIVIGAVLIVLVMNNNKEDSSTTNNSLNNSNNNTQVNIDKNDNTSNKQNNDKTVTLSGGTYKVPMKNIYIDVPNYQEIEEGYTEVFIVHESKYVAITSNRKATAQSAKEAHEIAFEKFKTNMQNYEGGVNSIKIEKDETKQINGIDLYFFEGKINYGTSTIHDGYAIGYSFVMDGIPCEIIGSVIDDSQSTQLIHEIQNIVNAMIKTVRSEQ